MKGSTIVARPVSLIWGSLTPFFKWLALSVAVLFLVAVAGLFFVNRHLPAFIEQQLNAHVEGYRFTVGEATLLPTMSLEIRRLTMIQTEHPFSELGTALPAYTWNQVFGGPWTVSVENGA